MALAEAMKQVDPVMLLAAEEAVQTGTVRLTVELVLASEVRASCALCSAVMTAKK